MSWKESFRAHVTLLVSSVLMTLAVCMAWKAGQKLAAWISAELPPPVQEEGSRTPSDALPPPIQEEGNRTAQENDEFVGELTPIVEWLSVFCFRREANVTAI